MLPSICKQVRIFSSWQNGRRSFHTSNNTRGGTRTHNLLLRREAPYPLGHTSCAEMQLPLIQPWPRPSTSRAQLHWATQSACTLLRATADANKMVDAPKSLTKHQLKDTLPEWSKGVDSSSTSASCVGSNPTGVIIAFLGFHLYAMRQMQIDLVLASTRTGQGNVQTQTQTGTFPVMPILLQHRGPLGLMDKASDF